MSTLTRVTAKTFLKSLDKYESHRKMVERALDPVKPTLVKSLPRNRSNLDESFLDLCHTWRNYRRDLDITAEEFNAEDDDQTSKYEHNDKWMEIIEEAYYEVLEKSDEKLEEIKESSEEKDNVVSEEKVNQERKMVESFSKQIEVLSDNITSSIDKMMSEIRKMEDGSTG